MSRSTVSRRVSEFVGVALFGAALIWIISLASYEPADPVWFFSTGGQADPANFAGRVGAFLAELSFQLFGYASYLIPAVLVVDRLAVVLVPRGRRRGHEGRRRGAAVRLHQRVSEPGLRHARRVRQAVPRRRLCRRLARHGLSEYLNRTGSVVVILTLIVLAIIMSTQFSFGRFFGALFGDHRERRGAIARLLPRVARGAPPREAAPRGDREAHEERRRPAGDQGARHWPTWPGEQGRKEARGCPAEDAEPSRCPLRHSAAPSRSRRRSRRRSACRLRRFRCPIRSRAKAPAERRKGEYALPPLALLDAPKTERKIDERELMDGARLLEEKCREFSVEGSVVQIHPGPVVTTFEFKPDAGVKYSKITGLADDLCLAMQAESVLIDRIPGKSTVGIQIPNRNREQISLREMLESEAYRRSTSKLTLALGKTIHGEPFMADLATMPHLLIAGSTGAGKSVGINGMLTSILYRATPDDVRMIMIDPKRLELGMYDDIPHLMTPVVVDPKQAANALRWAVREMEERYKTLAAEGVRNIEQYNRNVHQSIAEKRTPQNGETPRPLPFIVVVIDELADLMMVASNEVEESIARLAQMARAVGIHLILATQRPSVDVITGLIKANLPARISFRCSSKIDSRTILDGNGAEQLLGSGDMLFVPPASSRFIRLHGPYISEQESARLASYLRKQGKPVYDTTITAEQKTTSDAVEMEKDDLYDEAARIIVQSGQPSISYLQRRLRIGFSRAARLVDMMEMEGLVSPAVGGTPREVLVDKHYFDEVDSQLR